MEKLHPRRKQLFQTVGRMDMQIGGTPSKPNVEINPGKPKQWSPCKWEINTLFSRENFNRERRSCN